MKFADQVSLSPVPAVRQQIHLSLRKKLLFAASTTLLMYSVAEACASLVLCFCAGGRDEVSGKLRAATVSDKSGTDIDPRFEVLHPYLGFVMHVRNDDFTVQGTREFSVTDYGFYDAGSPIRRRAPDKVLVGIVGGSVAHHFSVLSSDALAAVLQQRFPGRKIEFVRLALGGFKQPQQLMTLSYVLALGGELDVLINIDGFNEVALPGAENVDYGVFAAFPRSWHRRVVAGNDLQLLRRIGYIAYCREERRKLADRFQPWHWSPLALVLWHYRNQAIENRISKGQRDAGVMSGDHLSFCAQGPSQSFDSRDLMYAHFADIWRDCSLQLHRLCAANGIEYYHFLQPTRHFPRIDPADPSTSEQRGIPDRVQLGYPLLLARGQGLRERGVEFHDLTGIFRTSDTSMYIDFCHFGKPANDLMAERIGNTIVRRAAAIDR